MFILIIAIAAAFPAYLLMKLRHRHLAMTSHDDDGACFVSSILPQDEQSPPPLLPPSSCPQKPTLVLDLDETLVHAKVQLEEPSYPARMIVVEGTRIWLALRPLAHQFLSLLAVHYELVVWTAGTEPYGRAVVNELDPSGSLISHSLFRQHCTQDEGVFVKDLSRLGRDERTRICDNNPVSFRFQPDAGILVKDFYGDPYDGVLKSLLTYLTKKVLLDSFDGRNTEVRRGLLTVTSNNVVCVSSPCNIGHDEEQDDEATIVEQDDGATDMEVCHGLLAVTSNNVVCSSSPCFIGHMEQGGEAVELSVDEGSQVVSVPYPKRSSKRSSSPRRSERLARLHPRRSSRIAAARRLVEN